MRICRFLIVNGERYMISIKRNFLKLILIAALFITVPVFSVRAENVGLINTQFLNDINSLRASKGLSPLSIDASLVQVASIRAQEASTTWSHTRPNGTQGVSMLPSNKWRGENLAYVQYGSFTFTDEELLSAESLMFANLKASPTHYNNMVFGDFTKVGIVTYVSTTGNGYKFTTAFMFTN